MTSRNAGSIVTLVAAVRKQKPGIAVGTGRHDPGSDHDFESVHDSQGVGVVRAADIMVGISGKAAGDVLSGNIAAKLGKHPAMGAGAYVIWRQHIMSTDRRGEGWRLMEDRGSPTDNHMDHVHVSVCTAQAGYDYRGSWGALFTGSGTGAAPTPAGPAPASSDGGNAGSLDSAAAYAAHTGAGGGAGAVVAGLVDGPDIRRLVLTGAGLALGWVLVALGAARLVKPAAEKLVSEGANVATLAVPEARAATAAMSATKGASA